ncbi:MAG: lipopolysaccharide heptosyltransferase I [Rhodocyclaceae bacterium]|jgi:heptosyltransferase-1|nr:lipopolysaccharide heptosyltransferase I [Rhodocyclaceae bacterium]
MRILLVKTSSLGDVVHNLPVVGDLHRHLPQARIDWVVEEAFADIPRLHPDVRNVIPVAVRHWRRNILRRRTCQEIRKFRENLRAEAYDLVIDTQGLLKSALIAAQSRLVVAGRRCGLDRASVREPIAACFYDNSYAVARDLHAVERNRALAAAAAGYTLDTPPDYGLSATPLMADWLPTRPYAVLLTATSRADKLWPEADWIALGRELAARGQLAVLPAGSREERERAQRIAGQIPHAIVAPPLGITPLAGLLAGAWRVIGVDTGLTHLAAALGRPCVALFCASEPGLTGVHAGSTAVNLGHRGRAPDIGSVLTACGD